MGTPDDPSIRSVKSKAADALGLGHKKDPNDVLPNHRPGTGPPGPNVTHAERPPLHSNHVDLTEKSHPNRNASRHHSPDNGDVNTAAQGETSSTIASEKLPLGKRFKAGSLRFLLHTKNAITHSWINLLLVFVPAGIVVKVVGLRAEVVFSMNAIAIIPLAGLLAHATEVVAVKVGDALGALLNVSFGNAVELILFIILLASNQIAVVQAALLGSILANLLLILGMAFLLGGLKYQEQVHTHITYLSSHCTNSFRSTTIPLPRCLVSCSPWQL